MTIKTSCSLFLGTFLLVSPAAYAQTADQDFAAGTNALIATNLVEANLAFSNAVVLAPTNEAYNAFYALTELLSIPAQPSGSNFLTRIGVSVAGRNILQWKAKLSTNTKGKVIIPTRTPPINADEFTGQLRGGVLSDILGAGNSLAMITDTNFTLDLTMDETHMAAFTMDWGDVHMLRAICDTTQVFIDTTYSWNANVQLAAAANVMTKGTFLTLLTTYPNLFATTTTADLPAARNAFAGAITNYFAASEFIRNRPADETRLFNLNTNKDAEELALRQELTNLLTSLTTPVPLNSHSTNNFSAAALFDGGFNIRSFFPQFVGKNFIAGSFPDPTFAGLIGGLTEAQIGQAFTKRTHIEPTNADIVLLVDGYGSIRHAAWPKTLVNGKTYTVTAVAKANNVFSNWTGGTSLPLAFLSSDATYSFTMEPNLSLEATFVTNVFVEAKGAYHGLFAPTNTTRQQTNSGSFIFTVASTGTVSGALDLGGQNVACSGKFNLLGAATIVTKATRVLPALTVHLQLNFADQSLTGTVSNSSFNASLTGFVDAFTGTAKATAFEGQYTFAILGSTNPAVGPFGTSYGTARIDAKGNVTVAGRLADGTTISQASVVSADGWWPFYVNLYGSKGSLWSWNYVSNSLVFAPAGLSWINATNSSKTAVYRSGFTNQSTLLSGGLYVSTVALPTGLPLVLVDSNISLSLTNLTGNTNKLAYKANKTTGVVSGSFANPNAPKKTIKFNGVIIQPGTNVQGYFLDTNQSGKFTIGTVVGPT